MKKASKTYVYSMTWPRVNRTINWIPPVSSGFRAYYIQRRARQTQSEMDSESVGRDEINRVGHCGMRRGHSFCVRVCLNEPCYAVI